MSLNFSKSKTYYSLNLSWSHCPNVSTTYPITAMRFSAMFTIQLDNNKR